MGSCRAWSVYLTSKRLTSIVHILSPENDNCSSWHNGMERMTIENISWSISMKECCWPGEGPTPNLLIPSQICIQLWLRIYVVMFRFLILLLKKGRELIWSFLSAWLKWSRRILEEAIAASRWVWNNSVVKIVDITVACLIDLATTSKSLDKALTIIDSCCADIDKLWMK